MDFKRLITQQEHHDGLGRVFNVNGDTRLHMVLRTVRDDGKGSHYARDMAPVCHKLPAYTFGLLHHS